MMIFGVLGKLRSIQGFFRLGKHLCEGLCGVIMEGG